jgi:hypothetical protein
MNPLTRPALLLRMEGVVVLAAALIAFQRFHPGHWGMFTLLFLAPDISLLGYLVSANKLSAAFYNTFHSYVLPLALLLLPSPLAEEFALIWISHIGFDRLMGYGLKYPGIFRFTPLPSKLAIRTLFGY